ncbi:tRNA (uracil-5-)-methyltransferase [Catenovulum agarivorans DS-2]|uniref:tRNA/tmRNA (uracil-C(5))-methyltransferase n=1 Tax=Catenovulum agarivorans DS-2 TaxID=1328313 RepID=W7QEJ8_9ALTE|nr:tRNA (uridine(54)-C5)-methyltransferase TrmA [Catenovulum agarivorans]EWH10351.1 tRNA (uracil-5-)-methyltransferase [Catenovulum agarivorans DS-2]
MRVNQIDPNQYGKLLSDKVQHTLTYFAGIEVPKPSVVESVKQNYRLRAEFRVWHQDEDSFYIMFDPETKEKYRVDYYLPGSELLNKLMQAVRQAFLVNPELRYKLYQVDFLTSLSGEALVSLIYHKPLDDRWQNEAKILKQQLNEITKVNLIGRARKTKILLDQDYIIETFDVNGQQLSYKQIENSFTQPNGFINQKMLEWAANISHQLNGDLLELYCGNGNFSLALACKFNRVLATEIARSSVKAAQFNISLNNIDNVVIGQSSAEDFSAAYFEGKSVKSLKDIKLSDYQFSTILVDPPRAGLDRDTEQLVSKFDNILYISCNPETLANNIRAIQSTHQVQDICLFDQFPYTHHIESAVWLTKR